MSTKKKILLMSDHLRRYLDYYGLYVSIVYDTTHPDILTGAVVADKDFFCLIMEVKEDDEFFKMQDVKRRDITGMNQREAEDALVAICVLMDWDAMDTVAKPHAMFIGNKEFLSEAQGTIKTDSDEGDEDDEDDEDDSYNGYLN